MNISLVEELPNDTVILKCEFSSINPSFIFFQTNELKTFFPIANNTFILKRSYNVLDVYCAIRTNNNVTVLLSQPYKLKPRKCAFQFNKCFSKKSIKFFFLLVGPVCVFISYPLVTLINNTSTINYIVSGNPFPQAVVRNAHGTYLSLYPYQFNSDTYVNEGVIEITEIAKHDHGEIVCSASNDLGNTTRSYFITVVCMLFL